MSAEILLIAGPSAANSAARRATLVEHAAKEMPGVSSYEIAHKPGASVALVHTEPANGSFAILIEADGGFTTCVANSPSGLEQATTNDSHELGAEAGHVAVRVDGQGSVTLSTDGTAFIPCYWGVHGESLYVSTHLASLVSLGVPSDVDTQGVLEYLVLMHPWQHRTLLRRAQLLPPGGRVDWSVQGGVHVRAQPLYLPSDDAMTDDEAIAIFRELWPTIINDLRERTADRRTALGLSGGLDSRAIATQAARIGWRPTTYTYGTVRNNETAIAVKVANRLGLPHMQLPVTHDRLLPNGQRAIDILDGAHSPGEMYEIWFEDTLRSFADVIVNGLVAGPLWGDDKSMGLTDHLAIAGHLRARFAGTASSVKPFLSADLRHELDTIIGAGIDESLEPWDFARRADMTLFWKQANKLLRWGSMLTNALRRSGLGLEAPFLDSRFLQFAARLTPEQRLNGRLYLRVQREVLSATADIPRSDDGNSPSVLNHVYWSGERSFIAQMATLTTHRPVAGLRRGGRRVVQVGSSKLQGSRLAVLADHLEDRRSVFPSDLWMRTRPTYSERLATMIESSIGASSIMSESAMTLAAKSLRSGGSPGPALVLTRLAAANGWMKDYQERAARAPVLAAEQRPDVNHTGA